VYEALSFEVASTGLCLLFSLPSPFISHIFISNLLRFNSRRWPASISLLSLHYITCIATISLLYFHLPSLRRSPATISLLSSLYVPVLLLYITSLSSLYYLYCYYISSLYSLVFLHRSPATISLLSSLFSLLYVYLYCYYISSPYSLVFLRRSPATVLH